jgi:hypothetical protein
MRELERRHHPLQGALDDPRRRLTDEQREQVKELIEPPAPQPRYYRRSFYGRSRLT